MIAILSDIHGNAAALRAVLSDADKYRCQRFISLGDVAGYYADINECIELLMERSALNILGNHDSYLISGSGCPRSDSANRCLQHQKAVVSAESLAWLKRSAPRLDLGSASLVHGGWEDSLDEYVVRISSHYFERFPYKQFFSGHTHVQILADLGTQVYCNPGSVGQPRDGDWRAAYALFDGSTGEIMLRRVEYDIGPTAKAMQKAGFPEYFFSNLYKGTRIGGAISEVRIAR